MRTAVELHSERKLQQEQEDRESHKQDQFLLAAIERPTRFRTRLHEVQYEGATARKDAEEETRSRCLHVLCGIVSNTNTPMRRMVRDKPSSIQLLVAGKRASTLRARSRPIRKYAWLASAFSVSFPRETSHVLEHLQVRSNEPSCRGAVKGAHQAMCFFEEGRGFRSLHELPGVSPCKEGDTCLCNAGSITEAGTTLPNSTPRGSRGNGSGRKGPGLFSYLWLVGSRAVMRYATLLPPPRNCPVSG